MRRFPTARENFPPCPHCGSRAVAITLLTFYLVSMQCDACSHRFTLANDEVPVQKREPAAGRDVAVAV
jgi:DNA-directed RNA polymerase subunit RPC12/RpoP